MSNLVCGLYYWKDKEIANMHIYISGFVVFLIIASIYLDDLAWVPKGTFPHSKRDICLHEDCGNGTSEEFTWRYHDKRTASRTGRTGTYVCVKCNRGHPWWD